MLRVSHIVNSIFTSRTYVLSKEGENACWIVDCGDVEPLLELFPAVAGEGYSVRGVLLTHAHYDHIYGLPRLAELFPDVRVYTCEAGLKALQDPRLNMSKYHDAPIVFGPDRVAVCGEGDRVGLFDGVAATVYETPGHHPSCLAFEAGGYLFTGDAYIPGIAVVTTLPGGNKALAAASRERLQTLAVGRALCPGHEVAGLPEGIVLPGRGSARR